MGAKTKGTGAERELVHLFWEAGWTACRIAGSGSMHYPSPDILASKENRQLAIECKATKSDNQYFDHQEITALRDFARVSGAEAWIGVRFPRENWRFVRPDELVHTGKHLALPRAYALQKGTPLDRLLLTKHL